SRRRHTRSYGDWSSDVCSSDLADLLSRFTGPVEQLVERKGQVRALRHVQLVLGPDAALAQGVELGEQRLGIEYDAIADDANRPQIGRASCREREEHPVEDGGVE